MGPRFGFRNHYESSQHRHHRPRRPRQDHAGRPAAAAIRRLSREPARGRARHGFQRPRARARHHHPGQGRFGALEGHPHQYRRYARPRRFRRRGGAHPQHGRRRAGAGGCRRRSAAADQVRGVEGAQDGAQAHRRHQQGGPLRRAAGRSHQRSLRPVRRARRQRRATRFPDSLRLGQAGLDGDQAGRLARRRHAAAVRSHPQPRQAAGGGARPVPPARHHSRSQSLSRPPRHRPHHLRLGEAEPAGEGARPRRQADRDRPHHQVAGVPRSRARAGGRGGSRRHRRHRRTAERDRGDDDLRSRRWKRRSRRSRSIRRRWR